MGGNKHDVSTTTLAPPESTAVKAAELDPLFEVHMLNESGKAKARTIAEQFNTLLVELEPLCSDGREFSIVRTHLEAACFYAKKCMAKQPQNQA